MSTFLDALQGLGQGGTLGTLPYMQAGLQYAVQPFTDTHPQSYADYVNQAQQADSTARSNSPTAYMLSNLAGGFVPGTGAIGAIRDAAPGLSALKQALIANTGQGIVQGLAAPVQPDLSNAELVKAHLLNAAKLGAFSAGLSGIVHGAQQNFNQNTIAALSDPSNLSAKTAQTAMEIADSARNSLHSSVNNAMQSGAYSLEHLGNTGGAQGIPLNLLKSSDVPAWNEIQSAINSGKMPQYRTDANSQNIGGLSTTASNVYNKALDNQIASRLAQLAPDGSRGVGNPDTIKAAVSAPIITLGDIQNKLLNIAAKNPNFNRYSPNISIAGGYTIPDKTAAAIQDSANSLISGLPDSHGYTLGSAVARGVPFVHDSGTPAGMVNPNALMDSLSGSGNKYLVPGSIGSSVTQVPVSAFSNFAGQQLGNLSGQ
jgi:hypothetical protein